MRTTSMLIFLVALLVLAMIVHRAPLGPRGETHPVATAPSEAGVLVLDLQDDTSARAVQAFAARHRLTLTLSSAVSADEGLYRAVVPDLAAAIQALSSDPLVEAVEPVVTMTADGVPVPPNDPRWSEQWNLRRIGAPAGWQVGGGRGVRVAVVDTGVSLVEDLADTHVLPGRSFVPGVESWEDDVGHGTHVAGTIAQSTHNGIGVAGVAPRASILPVKVLGVQGGDSDHVAAGIDWAVDQGADVINLSLGGPPSDVLLLAVDKAADAGVIVVASVGNAGMRQVGSPASHARAIGVSATGPDDSRAPYSNYGPGVELAAPGGDVRTAGGGILQNTLLRDQGMKEGYAAFQGTSMAAPHVSGAAAVLLGRGLASQAVVDALYASALELGRPGWDEEYGYGRLDVAAAVAGQTAWRDALLSFLAALIAAVLGRLARLALRRVLRLMALSVLVTGLLAILAWMGLPSAGLTMGPLFWPSMVDPDWVHFPLWISALVPALLVFVLGPSRAWPLAAAVAIAWGVSLLWGAGSGGLDPWWFSGMGDALWLVVHGLLCVVGAMAVVGMHGAAGDRKGTAR